MLCDRFAIMQKTYARKKIAKKGNNQEERIKNF